MINLGRAIKLLSVVKGLVKKDYDRVSGLMGEMHGLPQKLGQHFTLYNQRDFGQYFAALCTKSGIEEVNIEKALQTLGVVPDTVEICAQASIGQVYRVETVDRPLAVKVKYPLAERKIRSDFRVLRSLLFPARLLPLRKSVLFSLLNLMETLLLAEGDYTTEAENQRILYELFKKEEDIYVPEVVAHNDQAIASEWIDGELLCSMERPDPRFVESYLKFVLLSLSKTGLVHTDPHPGNFILTPAGGKTKLTVVDFGSVASFDALERQAVIRLLSGDYEHEAALADDLLLLGLERDAVEMYRPILGDLVSIIFEPFYYPGEYNFANWRFQYKMNTLLGSRPFDQPLTMPDKLILLARTVQGLYYYARQSRATINWHSAARE